MIDEIYLLLMIVVWWTGGLWMNRHFNKITYFCEINF